MLFLLEQTRRKRSRNRGRRAFSTFLVLCCLGLVMMLSAAAVKIAFASHQAVQTAAWNAETLWLVESGLQKAQAALAADEKYAGETWTISAEQLQGQDPGVVRIRVEPVADQPQSRIVRVEADYPDDPVHRVRSEKEKIISLPKSSKEEKNENNEKEEKTVAPL